MSSTHILDYKDKNLATNISFKNENKNNNINSNDSNLNKSGNNFYEKKIKEKFFNGNIIYNGNETNIIDTDKDKKKTNSIISINLKYIEPHQINNTNTNVIMHKKNNSISNNNIINIKVKMTNRIIPANSIRDKQILVEQINQEQTTTTNNLVKKDINLSVTKQNVINNNDNLLKQKNNNKNIINNVSKYINKLKKTKNITESKSQNKTTKISIEKHFNNNENTNVYPNFLKKTYPNFSEKMISTKLKEKEKSKGKEKELTKNKKISSNFSNDFQIITHRSNNKGNSLSSFKPNKIINTKVIKYSNIDCIKKKFIEGPLTINEIEEKSDTMIYKGHSFVINIISNWGNKKKVGMTEIELFHENINRLYNNKIHTINDNEMWSMDISKRNIFSNFLNIYLYIYANIDNNKPLMESINYILIWNYKG